MYILSPSLYLSEKNAINRELYKSSSKGLSNEDKRQFDAEDVKLFNRFCKSDLDD
jgi:hypothetical protein